MKERKVCHSQIIYELDSVDYGILSAASYDDLRHQEVFWGDFDDVTQIDITLEGESHTLTSEWDEENEERIWHFPTAEAEETEETTEETQSTESAEEEDELDVTDLTDAIKALSATEFTAQKPEGKEGIRLTLHLDNEDFPKVEIILYRYDGSSCLAVVDGQSVSLVPRASVIEVVEAVQAIVLN